jgi:hypothetical protein
MSQYEQAQPYSFTSMPPSYTGGYDATAYTPTAAPVNRYADIMAQDAATGGGGGHGPVMPSDEGGTYTEPTSQQAYNVTQFGRNIKYVSPLTGLLSTVYGNYLAGQVNPNYSNEGKNYPAQTGGFVSATPAPSDGSNYSNEGRNAPAPSAPSDGSNYSNEGRTSGGSSSANSGAPSGGGVATGGNNGDASGGGDRGTRGGFAYGGHVSMQHLQGPNPEGPDDGYAALKDGEYVINDKAVKKYGIELMNAINSGKISKGKLLGLLEM